MKKFTTRVLITMMCVAITSCGTTIGNRNAQVQTTQEVTAKPTIEPTEKPDSLIDLKKKEEIMLNVNMKVNGFSKEKKITFGSLYFKTNKKDNVFAIINVTLNNTTDTKKSFNLGYFRLIDQNGKEYIPTLIGSSKTDDYKFISINHFMEADYKETGCLAFEVPKDTKIKNCKLSYNDYGIQSSIYFKLK
ncbi:MAG: DUF4352 domain-containing protein [Clostridiales bacterium]|nr:DUF4352 domain-containing protein [Clostridiales bacterium]